MNNRKSPYRIAYEAGAKLAFAKFADPTGGSDDAALADSAGMSDEDVANALAEEGFTGGNASFPYTPQGPNESLADGGVTDGNASLPDDNSAVTPPAVSEQPSQSTPWASYVANSLRSGFNGFNHSLVNGFLATGALRDPSLRPNPSFFEPPLPAPAPAAPLAPAAPSAPAAASAPATPAAASGQTPTALSTEPAQDVIGPPAPNYYTVRRGDTNYNRIAKHMGLDISGRDLARYMQNRNLRVGDQISFDEFSTNYANKNYGNVYRGGQQVTRGALPPRRPAPVAPAPAPVPTPAPVPVARAQSTITPRAPGSRGSQLLNQLGLNRPRTMADNLQMGLAQGGFRLPQQRTRSQIPIGKPGTPRATVPSMLRPRFGQSIIDGLSAVAPRNPDIIPGGF